MRLYRNAIILAVILALLGGAYVYISKKPSKSTSKDTGKNTIKIMELDSNKLNEITINNRGSKFVFVKKDNDWSATYPEGFKADKGKLGSIAIDLSSLTADKVIEENAADLAQYGLNNPVEVTAKLSDGTSRVIEIGDQTPSKGAYYVMEKGTSKVYTISSYTGDMLAGDKNKIRDMTLVSIKPEDAIGFAMGRDGQKVFSARKVDANSWNLIYPIEGNAALDKLTPMLSTVSALSAKDYIEDNAADLDKYGLKNPSYTLEVETASGKTEILFGHEKTRGSEIYAKLGTGNSVFTLDESNFNFLDKPLKEIIEVFAYIVNIQDVSKIDVDLDGKTTTCGIETDKDDKDKDKFTVNGKDAAMKDSNDKQYFRTFYQALIGVTLSEIEPQGKPSGKADITFTYYLKKDPGTMKVEFVPKDNKYYYVVRNGKYSGIIVEKSKFDEKDGVRDSFKKLMDAVAAGK